MFCPKCGSIFRSELYGGVCKCKCDTCKAALNCRHWYNDEKMKDSFLTWNPLKAVIARLKYEISF